MDPQPSPSHFPASFTEPWIELLAAHRHERDGDLPSDSEIDIPSLQTSCVPRSLFVGTGYSIFSHALLPALLRAKVSVDFATCYWAASPTLDALRETLSKLASSRMQAGRDLPKLRITIGFSSRGLLQKLFHTSSKEGYLYPPSRWPALGLPGEAVLEAAGIEMAVKSLFFTPLSVVHPKYVIVDGGRAFMPSCNVSWERWFEGCIEFQGDVVSRLLRFHRTVWQFDAAFTDPPRKRELPRQAHAVKDSDETYVHVDEAVDDEESAKGKTRLSFSAPVPTILLPSSHHRNPHFRLFPFLSCSRPPMTPLNAALLTLFRNAKQEIVILTPNLTSTAVLDALRDALDRGVNVRITTSKSMMVIEQLVTSGTTTSRCIRKLIRAYRGLRAERQGHGDVEAQAGSVLGQLSVHYYKPLASRIGTDDEPALSHFKVTLVDGEYLVLGSGNMDRASWWTSQELGVLLYVPDFAEHKLWGAVLNKRTEAIYRSSEG